MTLSQTRQKIREQDASSPATAPWSAVDITSKATESTAPARRGWTLHLGIAIWALRRGAKIPSHPEGKLCLNRFAE
jgi:hypothetical protein